MPRGRRHPRGSVIAYIWIGVFVAGFLVAIFFQDDDPNTDEGAGAGALIFIAGMVLTVVYLAIGKRLNSRIAAVGDGEEDVRVALGSRSWVRRNLGPLAAGAAAVVVLVVASVLAPSSKTVTRPKEPAHGSWDKGDLAAMIRAAASAASSDRRITSLDCVNPVDVKDALLLTCAVTFEGPACQLWLAGGVDDREPAALGEPADGRSGWADDRTAHCG